MDAIFNLLLHVFTIILNSRTQKYMLLSVFGMFSILWVSIAAVECYDICICYCMTFVPISPFKILRTVVCNHCNTS